MRHADEIQYYAAIRAKGRGVFADVVARNIDMDENRAYYLLEKWYRAGWWDFGVSMRSGWLTDEAPLELAP